MTYNNLKKYRKAILEKFPEFPLNRVEYLGEGWDSLVCLVNTNFIFRFPKREEVEHSLLKEIHLLPVLAAKLTTKIPDFKYISTTSASTFPFAFAGYKRIDGIQLEECSAQTRQADWWKPQLGEFLRELHSFPVSAARKLEVPFFSFTEKGETESWRESLTVFYQEIRKEAFGLLEEAARVKVEAAFETFLSTDCFFQFEPALIHGDLSQEHVLLDLANKSLAGIIDFGDCSIGDPAFDVWDEVLPFYHGTTDSSWLERRRFYLRLGPLHALVFGVRFNDPALIEYGIYSLDF